MDRWLRKTAVVTGAASGIGKAITCALLRNGVNVAALDVQKEGLAKLDEESKAKSFPGVLHPICCDVSVEKEIDAAFLKIETELGGVHIMVNNAGVCDYSSVIDSDRKAFEKLLNINVLAVTVCTVKAVRSMRDRNVEGHIFYINSVLGHQIPSSHIPELSAKFNLYPTCKHGTVALAKTVRQELTVIKAPIRVTSISPGLVRTNITKHIENLKDFYNAISCLEPDDIADALIYALGRGPKVEIAELTIQHIGEQI